jgi:hypothetical protein
MIVVSTSGLWTVAITTNTPSIFVKNVPYSAKVKPPQRAANFRTLLEPALDALKFGTPRYRIVPKLRPPLRGGLQTFGHYGTRVRCQS